MNTTASAAYTRRQPQLHRIAWNPNFAVRPALLITLAVLIVVAVFVLLFGSRKLPDAARSLGRSMRILKAEAKALRDDDTGDDLRAPAPGPTGRASSR